MNIIYIWSKILKKIRGASIRDSKIHKTSVIESGSNVVNSIFDKYSFCGYDCEIVNCKIGAFVSIANNVVIGGAMHPMKWVSMSPVFYSGKDSIKKKFSTFKREEDKMTIIGHDVWIGQYSLIKQGCIIGNGAVIGMGSVVTKDVPPYAIVAGNPAKLIRYRFTPNVIERLESSRWWSLEDSIILKLAKNIQKPELFLKELESL